MRSDLLQGTVWRGNALSRIDDVSTRVRRIEDELLTYAAGDGRYVRKAGPGGVISVYNAKTLFGAAGDDSTDDTTPIQNAIDVVDGNGGSVLYLPEGEYVLNAGLARAGITGHIAIVGAGPERTILKAGGDFDTLSFSVTAAATTTLNAEAELGDTSIVVSDATGIEAGDLLLMKSDADWYWQQGSEKKGEQHRVRSVSGTTVNLYEPVMDNYDVGGGEVVTVTIYRPVQVTIKDLTIEYTADAGDENAIGLSQFVNPIIRDVVIRGRGQLQAGVQLNDCYGGVVDNIHVTTGSDSGASLGYGVYMVQCYGTRVVNSHFYNCRRGVDVSGAEAVSRMIVVANNVASNDDQTSSNYSGFGTHQAAEGVLFTGNVIHGYRHCFVFRGLNITAQGNKMFGSGVSCFAIGDGDEVSIIGNTYEDMRNGRTGLTTNLGNLNIGQFVSVTKASDLALTVIGNKARGINAEVFLLNGGTHNYWVVEGNDFDINNNSSGANVYLFDASSATTLANSSICNNRYVVSTGIKGIYSSNITLALDSCSFDNYFITDTGRLTVWSGTGTLANVTVNVHVERQREGYAHVVGRVVFDVQTNTASVRLNNLATAAIAQRFNGIRENDATVRLEMVGAGNDLYISSDEANYNTPFAVGTGYEVDIDIRYRVA